MFNFIKNLFPYKAKSIEEFASFAKKEGCESVVITPYFTTRGGSRTPGFGLIAFFRHSIEFISMTPNGRKVIHQQQLFERFGSQHGFSDSDERSKSAIKHYLLCEQKINELRELFPKKMQLSLLDPKGQPMDKKMFKRLHKDALTLSVSI